MSTKISVKEKIAYALGDSACQFVLAPITAFLAIYYTDSVGIAAAAVGTMMLVVRLLDGVSDLLMGVVIDKTNTRFGKARPWVMISAPMMFLGVVALFNVPSGLGNTGKIIYAYATYIFVAVVAYTACNLSYGTLLALMTDQQHERNTLSAIRMILANITGVIVSIATPILVKNMGYGQMIWIYGVIALTFLTITFLGTKERIKVDDKKKSSNIPIKKSVGLLLQNKYFSFMTLIFILTYTLSNITVGSSAYYARYVLNSSGSVSLIILTLTIPSIVGLAFYPKVAKRFGKIRSLTVSYIILAVGYAIVFLTGKTLLLTMLGTTIVGVGRICIFAALFAVVADVIDYGEWKTGVRLDGLTNSITSFGMKVGMGLGGASLGWILAWGGYQGMAETQPVSAIMGIKVAFSLYPLILSVIAGVLMSFCKLDKLYPEIKKDLEARRTADLPVS